MLIYNTVNKSLIKEITAYIIFVALYHSFWLGIKISPKIMFTTCNNNITVIKVIFFLLENEKFEFSRKQYTFLKKHSKREFCAEFYYYF
jgi:hypothetical protein